MFNAVPLGELTGAVQILLARAKQDDVILAAIPITLTNLMVQLALCSENPAKLLDGMLAQFESDTRAGFDAMQLATAHSTPKTLHS